VKIHRSATGRWGQHPERSGSAWCPGTQSAGVTIPRLEPGCECLLGETFEAIVLDWDDLALPDRQPDLGPTSESASRTCAVRAPTWSS
jgi:hypothetical protein